LSLEYQFKLGKNFVVRLLNQEPLRDLIIKTADLLREPAGDDFHSMEAISKNRKQFIKRFHQGLYVIHTCAIHGIMTMEADIKAHKSGKDGSKLALQYIRQIFRSINDSLVWILLGKDAAFKVERLSRGKTRGNLIDQNPASVINFLDHVSSSGERIGIWNDATRCLDLSDVTVFDPCEGVSFLELKEGKVNDAIFETIRAGTIPAIDSFYCEFGEKGFKQLERTVKQQIAAQNHELLLKNDNLIDPFRGVYRATLTPTTAAQGYDDELKESLARVRTLDSTMLTIDDCLHLVIVNAQRLDRTKGKSIVDEYFLRLVPLPRDDQVDPRRTVLDFTYGFSLPTAMPVFLRHFDAEDIARLCIGDVQIYYCFDFSAWGKKLKNWQFNWTSQKEGHRERTKPFEQRLLIIDNRIPQIVRPGGQFNRFGGQFFLKLLFEGLRPNDLAAAYDEMPEDPL
jgi:hypothetical protein